MVAEHAEALAAMLAHCGVNLNFAPVVDLELNPANPIIGRYQRSFQYVNDFLKFRLACAAPSTACPFFGKRLQVGRVLQQVFRHFQGRVSMNVTFVHQRRRELAQSFDGMHMACPACGVQCRALFMGCNGQLARMVQQCIHTGVNMGFAGGMQSCEPANVLQVWFCPRLQQNGNQFRIAVFCHQHQRCLAFQVFQVELLGRGLLCDVPDQPPPVL